MSVELFIVRHGVAFEQDTERWPDDRERPLTSEGERAFRRAARGLRRISKPVDAVLSSPYVRAWRTAEILNEDAGWPHPRPFEALEADRSSQDALAALAAEPPIRRLAIVGHEPMLSRLCATLTGGGVIELKKGAVARLEAMELAPGGAVLRALFPPRVLRELRR